MQVTKISVYSQIKKEYYYDLLVLFYDFEYND